MNSIFLHLDLDAFFASVEQLDHPELRGKPVIVGANPDGRGVVAACSYEARAFGIHSAMPIGTAKQKCPEAIFLPVRMQRYVSLSQKIMGYLKDQAPRVHQVSVDEAFLDISGTEQLLGTADSTAATIKQYIQEHYGLCVSIGIGPNPYIAKLASAKSKPDGLLHVSASETLAFLDELPLEKLWGVGYQTLARLHELNIYTVSQLRAVSQPDLIAMCGQAGGKRLSRIARGEDPGIILEMPNSRSISSEHTFQQDIRHQPTIFTKLFELCHNVMFRVIHEGFSSQTVFVRVRSAQFETRSMQKTLPHPVYSSRELYDTAKAMMEPMLTSAQLIRLIGVGLGNISDTAINAQIDMFPGKGERQRSVEAAAARLQQKYGTEAITKAELISKENYSDSSNSRASSKSRNS